MWQYLAILLFVVILSIGLAQGIHPLIEPLVTLPTCGRKIEAISIGTIGTNKYICTNNTSTFTHMYDNETKNYQRVSKINASNCWKFESPNHRPLLLEKLDGQDNNVYVYVNDTVSCSQPAPVAAPVAARVADPAAARVADPAAVPVVIATPSPSPSPSLAAQFQIVTEQQVTAPTRQDNTTPSTTPSALVTGIGHDQFYLQIYYQGSWGLDHYYLYLKLSNYGTHRYADDGSCQEQGTKEVTSGGPEPPPHASVSFVTSANWNAIKKDGEIGYTWTWELKEGNYYYLKLAGSSYYLSGDPRTVTDNKAGALAMTITAMEGATRNGIKLMLNTNQYLSINSTRDALQIQNQTRYSAAAPFRITPVTNNRLPPEDNSTTVTRLKSALAYKVISDDCLQKARLAEEERNRAIAETTQTEHEQLRSALLDVIDNQSGKINPPLCFNYQCMNIRGELYSYGYLQFSVYQTRGIEEFIKGGINTSYILKIEKVPSSSTDFYFTFDHNGTKKYLGFTQKNNEVNFLNYGLPFSSRDITQLKTNKADALIFTCHQLPVPDSHPMKASSPRVFRTVINSKVCIFGQIITKKYGYATADSIRNNFSSMNHYYLAGKINALCYSP